KGEIKFALGPGPHVINLLPESGALLISGDVKINGPGASNLTIQRSSGSFRIIEISGPLVHEVTIADVTIAGGMATGASLHGAKGGGIYDDSGKLTLNRDVLNGNTALGATGSDGWGGGVYYAGGGGFQVDHSMFTGNIAQGGDGAPGGNGGNGLGGGIYNTSGGVQIDHSMFQSNQAIGGAGGTGGNGSAAGDGGAGVDADSMGGTGDDGDSSTAGNGTGGGGGGSAGGGAVYNTG